MKQLSVRIPFKILILILLIQIPVPAQDPISDEDLFEMDIEELLNVDISIASKKSEPINEAPSVVVVVPREEIEIYGDRNLHQLLQRQPSVYTRSSFVYSDNLAGFRGDMSTHAEMHTLILFNGRPIRESAQGHNVNMYTSFPLTALDSVELIRGPGSVLYGSNAFTGVINLKSRDIPDRWEFSIHSLAGSHRYFDTIVSGGGRYGKLGFVADVRAAGQHGYDYRLVDQAGVYDRNNRYDRNFSATTHLKYQNLTVDIFGSDLDAFTMGVAPFWSNPHSDLRNKKLFINTGYRIDLQERAYLELNATYNLQENSLTRPQPQRVGTNTSDIIGEVTLFANPKDNMNLILGYLREYRSNYKPEDNYYQSIPEYDHKPQSAYAQGDYTIDENVKLIAGTQWNESSEGHSDFVSRYGVILMPFERWGLKLLRGEAFRAPVTLESDLYDPPILVGNDDLKPEMITTYDAQLFYQDKKTYAAVTYFNSTIEDLIIYNTSVAPMTYINGGEQKFDGVEFETKHFLSSHWHLLGSFMYQNNKADAGLNPSVVPEKMAKLGAAYTWKDGSASIFYSYFGTPPQINIPGVTLFVNDKPRAMNLLNMNVRMDVSKWMGFKKERSILTLRAENILNEKENVPTFAYTGSPNSFPYGTGTTFYAGMTIHF
jgi:outer membrane receptor for ferrienterochelin and colicins